MTVCDHISALDFLELSLLGLSGLYDDVHPGVFNHILNLASDGAFLIQTKKLQISLAHSGNSCLGIHDNYALIRQVQGAFQHAGILLLLQQHGLQLLQAVGIVRRVDFQGFLRHFVSPILSICGTPVLPSASQASSCLLLKRALMPPLIIMIIIIFIYSVNNWHPNAFESTTSRQAFARRDVCFAELTPRRDRTRRSHNGRRTDRGKNGFRSWGR
ncbi:hypothetical protein SDC9_92459 [bioreactor metagenome]|uniref:Uncharacterized protein n=1 Tax=bioreactor metagenome TaxID=1076179 RepID=A0A644ZYD7_9ZZZZ